MKQVLHGNARTTPEIRRAIQNSEDSLQNLAKLYSINPKTVAKWRRRRTITDAAMGPVSRSAALTIEQEAFAIAFRRHSLLPLGDCLSALQAAIPHLSRSTLHRCFLRHGISRLPPAESSTSLLKESSKNFPSGLLRVDFAKVWSDKCWQHLYVAIDPASKVAFAEFLPQSNWVSASDFLQRVLEKIPYQVHTILTDKSIQFTWRALHFLPNEPSFDDICRKYRAKHQRIMPEQCWSDHQVESMTRTLYEAFDLRAFCENTEEINKQLQDFLLTYNHSAPLKALNGLTPHAFLCAQWRNKPTAFICDPTHLSLGIYTAIQLPAGDNSPE